MPMNLKNVKKNTLLIALNLMKYRDNEVKTSP